MDKEQAGWSYPRSLDNHFTSTWKPVRSGVPLGLVPKLFKIVISSTGCGFWSTLSRFAGGTRLSGAADVLEGRDAIRGTCTGLRSGSV